MKTTTPEEVHKVFAEIVVPVSTLPNLKLNAKDAEEIAEYSLATVVRALRCTAKWIAKRNEVGMTIHYNALITSTLKSCQYKRERTMAPKPKPVSTPASSNEQELGTLLDCFQANCSVEGDWTLTNETAKELLSMYGANAVKDALLSLGTFDVDHAQEALDLLHFRLGINTLHWELV
jgi:hypothetical protein